MEKEERKEEGQEFRSLEVREASSSHLKMFTLDLIMTRVDFYAYWCRKVLIT